MKNLIHPSRGGTVSRSALLGRLLALLAAIFLVITGAGLTQTKAEAAQPNEVGYIRLFNPVLTTSGSKFEQWDAAKFTIQWEAPNGINGGESFVINFPPEINPASDSTFDLKDVNGTTGGSCVVSADSDTMTCTLNDTFANKDDVGGTLSLQLQAAQTTEPDQKTVEFDLNGEVTEVDIPTGVIVPDTTPLPSESEKWGWIRSDQASFTWPIIILGSDIAELGESPLIIDDQLSGRHLFKGSFSMYEQTGAEFPTNPWNQDGTANPIELTSVIAPDGKSAVLTAQAPAGGWDAEKVYVVYYRTVTDDDAVAVPGQPYGNVAKVNGKKLAHEVVRESLAEGSIGGVDQGSFNITKMMTADSITMPEGTTFTVHAVITTPDGVLIEESDYSIVPGQTLNGGKSYPKGTKITLSEIDIPSIPGIEFGDPVFTANTEGDASVEISADGQSAVLVMNSQANINVTVTNEAKEVPTTTSTEPMTSTEPTTPVTTPVTTPPVTTEPTTPVTTPVTTPPVTTEPTTPPVTTPVTTPPVTTEPTTPVTTPPVTTEPTTPVTTPPVTTPPVTTEPTTPVTTPPVTSESTTSSSSSTPATTPPAVTTTKTVPGGGVPIGPIPIPVPVGEHPGQPVQVQPAPGQSAPGQPAQQNPAPSKGKGQMLANTGADVKIALGGAMIFGIAGIALFVASRRKA